MKLVYSILLITCFLFSDNRLHLEKADIMKNKTIKGETIQYISGDVIFSKGTLTLKCQNGTNNQNSGIATLMDSVSSIQKNRNLTCDTLYFYSKEDKIISFGNPHLWDKNYELFADTIIVYTKSDSGVALGSVTLKQKGQIINSDRLEYKKSSIDTSVSYSAIGNVSIKDTLRLATCGRANYERSKEITSLELNPKISEGSQVISGEKIILTYNNEILENLTIPAQAHVKTSSFGFQKKNIDSTEFLDSTEFFDDLTGSFLSGVFKNGQLDSMRLEGMSTTLYHIFEDSIYQGKNETSGDTIIISFKNKETHNIKVIGGAEGSFYPDTIGSTIESPIVYSANRINYRLPEKETDLEGYAKIRHDNTDLESGYIKVDWETNILNALPQSNFTQLFEPLNPVIIERGKDPMSGIKMAYNLKTKKGRVVKGGTKADDGYYTGSEIRNETKKNIFIKNSTYTTCESDTPHFHFESKKMKIVQNDIVIARPIILHLAQIPIIGLPFGIFPHQGGQRHSGWIMPTYGESKSRGQYLDGLGFYWAPSQYWDSKITTRFGDRQGLLFHVNNRYHLRYKFSGSLYMRSQQFLVGSKNITDITSSRKSALNVRWTHRQTMRNNQSLNANITYSSSGDYNKKYGITQAERMNQKTISNLSYSKRWPKSKNSISTNLYSNQDLLINEKIDTASAYYIKPTRAGSQLNIINKTLPNFSFRHGQSSLFPTTATTKSWYNNINWNYGLAFTNKDRDYYESEKITLDDTTSFYQWKENKINEQNTVWSHTSSINAPQKLFKYISINPSLSIRSVWVDKYFDGIWNDSTYSFSKIEKNGFAARTTGSFSISANTKLYGIFGIPIGSLKVIRHTASPSIGYSYTPDFSKPIFNQDLGYFETHTDSLGNKILFDRFAGTLAGSTPKSESKSMNFSLNNIFQAKILKGEEEKKVDLLSWRLSTSYNFAADSMNLSNLRSSIRSKIAGKLNLDISMTHDFYKYVQGVGRVSDYNKNDKGLITPRLTSARFSTGFRFSGKKWADQSTDTTDTDSTQRNDDLLDPGLNSRSEKTNNTIKGGNLWNTNISLSYNISAYNPEQTNKTFWINTTSAFQITKKWKVSYRARFNMIERDLVNHSFSIYRDLHCWELSLNWTPGGLGQGINLRINVKSPTLRDLKYEKKGGLYSRSPF